MHLGVNLSKQKFKINLGSDLTLASISVNDTAVLTWRRVVSHVYAILILWNWWHQLLSVLSYCCKVWVQDPHQGRRHSRLKCCCSQEIPCIIFSNQKWIFLEVNGQWVANETNQGDWCWHLVAAPPTVIIAWLSLYSSPSSNPPKSSASKRADPGELRPRASSMNCSCCCPPEI